MSIKNLLAELHDLLGPERVFSGQAECAPYGRDMSFYAAVPEAVALVRSIGEVQKVMELASREEVPVTPRGAGTSVTGAVIPIRGGLVLDLSQMNLIKEINRGDRYVVVGPGVVLSRLNAALAPELFFPPDPGSMEMATLGGMISTNASGKNALKYGTTADYVLALEVVLAGGEVVRAGHRTPKASTGFDLTHLFVSAEGTLGVITEATLRVLPRPESVVLILAGYPTLEGAAEAAVKILAEGFSLSACELIDCLSIGEFSRKTGLSFPDTEGLLLMEVDGPSALVGSQAAALDDFCRRHGALCRYVLHDSAAREMVWRFRHLLVSSLSPHRRGSRLIPMAEDIGVPVSRVPEALRRSKELAAFHGVNVVLFGHVGDGNIHTTFVINPQDAGEWQRAQLLAADLNRLAMELDGTISAEHGIGLSKAPFIKAELGRSHHLMHEIKRLLDPQDLLNPGKLGFSSTAGVESNHFAFAVPARNPERLASLGSNQADQGALLCMMCGCCRVACPIFAVTGRECDNARGKVHLAYLLRTGDIQLSEDLSRKFYLCTNCGACERRCPGNVEVTGILSAVRRQVFRSGFLPQVHQAALASIQLHGHPWGKHLAGSKDLVPRHLNTNTPKRTGNRVDVLLFLGCRARYGDQHLTQAMLKLLDLADLSYALLGDDETCCAFPLAQWGAEDAFREQASRLATIIGERHPQVIATPCPGCRLALGQLYPQMLGDFSLKVMNLAELAQELVFSGALKLRRPLKKQAVVHDPCLLGRTEAPRQLLHIIPGLLVKDFPPHQNGSLCCGGGCGLPALAPEVSLQMANRGVSLAQKVEAQLLITACPTCTSQFRQALALSSHRNLEIRDLTEVVLMAAT